MTQAPGRCPFCESFVKYGIGRDKVRQFRCPNCGAYGRVVSPPRKFIVSKREKNAQRRRWWYIGRKAYAPDSKPANIPPKKTREQRIRDLKKAIRSKRTPPGLRKGAEKMLKKLNDGEQKADENKSAVPLVPSPEKGKS